MSLIIDQAKGTVSFYRRDPNGIGINRIFETRECGCIIAALGRSQAFLLCPKHEEQIRGVITPPPKDNWIQFWPQCGCLFFKACREIALLPCELHEAAALDVIIL